MKKEKFTKAAQNRQELVSLKLQMNEVLKLKTFTVNHKAHCLVMNSNSPEKGVHMSLAKGILTSKDTVKIAEVAERRIAKRIKKLEKAFKKL